MNSNNYYNTKPRSWHTTTEVASRIGLSRESINRWILEGKLKSHRQGVRHCIEEVDLQETLTKFFSDTWGKERTPVVKPKHQSKYASSQERFASAYNIDGVPPAAPDVPPAVSAIPEKFSLAEVIRFVDDCLTTDQIMEIRAEAEREEYAEEMLATYLQYWREEFRRTRQLIKSDER
jgi:excisionase family DNA binding protein